MMSLSMEEDVSMVRVFPSCEDLIEALQPFGAPDAVLMDLGLPGMGGLDAIRMLSSKIPDTVVMALTVFGEEKRVEAAVSAGAAGHLLKDADGAEIAGALRSCVQPPVI